MSLYVEKMCRRVTICKCTKFCNKATYFCLKTKLHWKGNVQNILLYSVIFFTKFDLYNTAFQSLLSLIVRIWELFCNQLEANFPENSSSALQKLVSFNYQFFASLVEKAVLSLTHGNKTSSNKNLVLMWHIFQQSEFKISK